MYHRVLGNITVFSLLVIVCLADVIPELTRSLKNIMENGRKLLVVDWGIKHDGYRLMGRSFQLASVFISSFLIINF